MKKRKWLRWALPAATALCALAAVLLLAAVPRPGGESSTESGPEQAQLSGVYQIDGGPWQELTDGAPFRSDGYHTVTIRGRLDRTVPEGQALLLYIRNLYVTLKVNGQVIYTTGGPEDVSARWKTPGVLWAEAEAGGVSPADEVELILINAYRFAAPSFHELLDNLQIGTRAQLYEQMLRGKDGVLLALLSILVLGLTAVLLAVLTCLFRWPNLSRLAALSLFAAVAGRWILREALLVYMPLLTPEPILCAALDILTVYLLPVTFVLLHRTYESRRFARPMRIIAALTAAFVAVLFLLQGLSVLQLYEMQPVLIFLEELVFLALNGMTLFELIRDRNRSAAGLFFTLLPAYAGALLENVNFAVPFMPRGTAAYVCCAVTLALQLWSAVKAVRGYHLAQARAAQLEVELAEARTSVMLSQIQPHFLYNVLGAIDRLCFEQPEEAHRAILTFSQYLRRNMDALTRKEPVPFEQELEHTRQYLALEQLRFEERLTVAWDIRCSRFRLPVLTLQPIVENAVRHGISKRPEGGAVTIRAEEAEDEFRVTVTDNGAGFDPAAPLSGGRSHVGLDSVRARLAALCGGRLTVTSAPGKGTTAVLWLPKDRAGEAADA